MVLNEVALVLLLVHYFSFLLVSIIVFLPNFGSAASMATGEIIVIQLQISTPRYHV